MIEQIEYPKIFIGSSGNSISFMNELAGKLGKHAEIISWTDKQAFCLSKTTIESLEAMLLEVDFAVFIFSADDFSKIKGRDLNVTRDNVVLETGMFIGALGRSRVFICIDDGTDLHIPTDLDGVTYAKVANAPPQSDEFRATQATLKIKAAMDNVTEKHPLKNRYSHDIRFAAGAICYRMNTHDQPEYLLVNTRNKGRSFPKSVKVIDETDSEGALRSLEWEGAATASLVSTSHKEVQHYKKNNGKNQLINFFIFKYLSDLPIQEDRRDPQFFSYEDALTHISEGRSATVAKSFRDALTWAHDIVTAPTSTVKYDLAGIVPYRLSGAQDIEILLTKSKKTGAWQIPKGSIEAGETPVQAAVREGEEESGALGKVLDTALGKYTYERDHIPHIVTVFPLLWEKDAETWLDQDTRTRQWVPLKHVQTYVKRKELLALINAISTIT